MEFRRTAKREPCYHSSWGGDCGGAYAVEALVDGRVVAELWRYWSPGCVAARMCVGGSYRGRHYWEAIEPESGDDLEWAPEGPWDTLSEAKRRLAWAWERRAAA